MWAHVILRHLPTRPPLRIAQHAPHHTRGALPLGNEFRQDVAYVLALLDLMAHGDFVGLELFRVSGREGGGVGHYAPEIRDCEDGVGAFECFAQRGGVVEVGAEDGRAGCGEGLSGGFGGVAGEGADMVGGVGEECVGDGGALGCVSWGWGKGGRVDCGMRCFKKVSLACRKGSTGVVR